MRILYLLIFAIYFYTAAASAQDSTEVKIAEFDKSFKYQHGTISIGNGVATVTVPPGFKYLDSVQALKILTDVWGNPKTDNMTLGFLVPEKQSVLQLGGYVFNIQYNAIGYVKDDDANEIDYSELLTQLQKETLEENPEREKAGYQPLSFVGWASSPFYDGKRHILHWAKEIKFGKDTVNTLNYNVRVLGRKGVLVLNAIATMNELAAVKTDVPHVLNVVNFSKGYNYSDYDSGIDEVAAWTIGGLVAGKILAKVGFFALILKFWKLVMIGFVAAGSFIKKLFTGRKSKSAEPAVEKEPIEAFNPVDETEEEKEPITAFNPVDEPAAEKETEENKGGNKSAEIGA
jgi:uncharacterized membrane-anchored protein